MKILTRFFAILGIMMTLGFMGFAGFTIFTNIRGNVAPKNMVLRLDLASPVVDQDEPSPLDVIMGGEQPTEMFDLVRAIDRAAKDTNVRALVAVFGNDAPSLAAAQEITDAVNRFRASGKKTYAFAPSYGEFSGGNRSYYIASHFDYIFMQPVGMVGLTGVGMEAPFLKGVFDKVGVQADFMQRKDYKSFAETFMRSDFSAPARVDMTKMIQNMYDQLATGIFQGWQKRADKMPKPQTVQDIKQILSAGPYTAGQAGKMGLLSAFADLAGLDSLLRKEVSADYKAVGVAQYLAYSSKKKSFFDKAPEPVATVAMIYGSGMISDGAGGGKDIAGGDKILDARKISHAFAAAAEDKNVKAIIFRVNSPGGSPSASETIRNAMIYAQNKGKKVIVSMGDVAASGGYWIAMNANKIVAEPATITGSIGVVAGKFVLGDLFKKIGVTWEGLATSDNVNAWSMRQAFTPAQRARMDTMLDESYQDFISRVSTARHIPLDKMDSVAGGRVWTGAQAQSVGLVDVLGGMDKAQEIIRAELKLPADAKLAFKRFPEPMSSKDRLLRLIEMFSQSQVMIGKINAMVTSVRGLTYGLNLGAHDINAMLPIAPEAFNP